MNEITDIKDAIRRINPQTNNYSVVCNVSDIDTAKCVCNCTPIDGSAVLVNVRLNASDKDGFKLIPKDGSTVLVTLINKTTGYVAMVSEVDEIHLNGINEDGLVKVNDLVAKLNNLENKVNTIIATFNAHTHVASSFGSPTTTPPSPVVGTLTPTVKTDLENIKVLHGS